MAHGEALAPALDISVAVDAEPWAGWPGCEARAEQSVLAAAAWCGVKLRHGAEVSVLLASDGQVRELNRIWRGQDKPTNVLSFPASDQAKLAQAPMLGDIVIAFETVAREARDEGKTFTDHFSHLVVHGFLHLVGFDHDDDAAATRMENLEREVLAGLGIGDPYAD